jgi:hypothetical protein
MASGEQSTVAEPLQAVAEAGFWYLAFALQAHMFRAPRKAFDMRAFAPEAQEFCNAAERRLYDACAAYAGVRHG